jgi:lysozyme
MSSTRKAALGIATAFAGLAIVGAGAWFLWLPGHRPELRSGERYGIDVSHHQGSIAWQRVAADGISFVYLKASEGSSFVDPRFDANWRRAGEAGIDRGAYHFFSLCSAGADQARNFLDVVPDRLELPPAVDLELSPDCTERPDAATARGELAAFLDLVEQTLDEEAVLYVGDDFETAYPFVRSLDRPQWRLRSFLRPTMPDWLIWQVGSIARVDGIVGPVGLDVLSASADDGG